MSIIGSNILAGAAGSGVSAYEIEQSLRFDGSSYLSRSPSTTGSRRKLTFSGWVKDDVPSSPAHAAIFAASSGTSYEVMSRDYGRHLYFVIGSPTKGETQPTNYLLRDPSAWYHFVFTLDSEAASSDDRMRLYINGTQTYVNNTNVLEQDADTTYFNVSGITHYVGMLYSSVWNWKGYMAECNYVDGQALEPDSFGEFDDSGVWRPIKYTGTYGTNGFYLKFDPSATNGIGHDHSGNGNNFTATGFTTSGTGTDVMSDTPTTNYATFNPLNVNGSITSNNGNLDTGTSSSSASRITGTLGVSSGKWYFEATRTDAEGIGNIVAVGVMSITAALGTGEYSFNPTSSGANANEWVLTDRGVACNNTTYTNLNSVLGNIDQDEVVQVCIDMDAKKIWFGIDNTFSGSPSAGTGEAFSNLPSTVVPLSYHYRGALSFNFGQRDFAYTPPTGFKALNTANLPAPDIADGSDYFNTVLYTGNSSTQSITGVGFQPDWVWAKSRDEGYSHYVYDVVRGAGRYINTNNTNTEVNDTTTLSSFDTDGFSLGSAPGTNNNTKRYVAWNWLAGGTGSSNTDGSITSTVSANPSAGFSIVTYTGTNANATVGHGLGVAPKMVICKSRNSSSHSWYTYHASLGSSKYLYLNLTAAAGTGAAIWNGDPTSTVFTLGTSNGANQSTVTYVAYCFAEVEGYSKFGSYTGNNASDGPFVYCGFKPRWIMRKATGDTSNWVILDTARDTYNETDNMLLPNTSGAESDGSDIDILSNGFKMRSAALNGSTTYIFAAFAEHPTGGSGVSPVTAR